MQVLDEEEADVFSLVLEAMRSFNDKEEVQLQGCAALQLLLQTGNSDLLHISFKYNSNIGPYDFCVEENMANCSLVFYILKHTRCLCF